MKWLLSIAILASLVTLIYTHKSAFLSTYDLDFWQREFSNSQVVMGDKATHFFPDGDLYAIVGVKYLFGQDPIYMHPEVPPLGKQLIGLGIILFNNANITSLILGLGSLGLVYLLSVLLLQSSSWALLVVFLTSLNSEFRLLTISPNLDIVQLFFILVALLSFLKSHKNIIFLSITALSIGAIMATKFYLNGLILLWVFIAFLCIKAEFKPFIKFIVSLPLVFVGLALPYYVSFMQNPSLIAFLKYLKWLTGWWAGNARVPPGRALNMIYTGQWRTWWEGPPIIQITEWDFTWPLFTTIGIFSIFLLNRRFDQNLLLIWIWSAIYLLFISLTSPFPRYFIAVFPFFILLTVSVFKKLTLRLYAK